MAATSLPSAVIDLNRVIQICNDLLRNAHDLEFPRDDLFVELNSLLPKVDLNSPCRDELLSRSTVYELVMEVDNLPLSVLCTLLNCGLNLSHDYVLYIIAKCFANRISDQLIELLVDHGAKPLDMVAFLCNYMPGSAMRIITALKLPVDVHLVRILSKMSFEMGPAYEASFEILQHADDRFIAAIKSSIPDLHRRFLYGDRGSEIKNKLYELLVNKYKYDMNYRLSGRLSVLEFVIAREDIPLLDIVLMNQELDLEAVGNFGTPLSFAIQRDCPAAAVRLVQFGARIQNVRREIAPCDGRGTILAKLITFLGFDATKYLDLDRHEEDHVFEDPRGEQADEFEKWIKDFKSQPRTLFETITIKLRNQLTRLQIMQLVSEKKLPPISEGTEKFYKVLLLEQFE